MTRCRRQLSGTRFCMSRHKLNIVDFLLRLEQRNIILDETTEEAQPVPSSEDRSHRKDKQSKSKFVGLIMIPGNSIVSAEVDRDSIAM